MSISRVLSQNINVLIITVKNVYQEMINSKCWSWEECKRDSRIHENGLSCLNKCKKSRKKAKYTVFME